MGTRICLVGIDVWNSWGKYDWNRKGYKNKVRCYFFRFFRLIIIKYRKAWQWKNKIIKVKQERVKEKKY